MMFNPHQLSHMPRNGMHLILRSATVFQSKGDVLTNCQSDKLSIRILKDGSYMRRQFKDTAFCCIHSIYRKCSAALAGI